VDPDQLSLPDGVALGADGSIWAVDSLYRRVQHYSRTGAFLGTFGSEGSAPGQFEAPVALATRGGEVIVADRALSSVQRFGTDGAYHGRIGSSPGSGLGRFSHPLGVAVDCRGTVYVADTDNVRVQRLGVRGATLCGDVDHDPAERLAVTMSARGRQHFARQFAIRLTAGCDRPCRLVVSGTVRVRHGRAFKLRAVTRVLDSKPTLVLIALRERHTDRVLAALRHHRRVSAGVTATAVDLRGQRVAVRRSIRLIR
jgi:DNA-binding beta-propeller fold protein YncE